MGSTAFPKLTVKVDTADKSDCKPKAEKGCACNERPGAAVPGQSSGCLCSCRGRGEQRREGRMGAELTALPLFAARKIQMSFFSCQPAELPTWREFRGPIDGLL